MAKDRIAGILLLIFCTFFYYQSTFIKVKNLTGLQATFFPRLLLGLIAILATIMIIQSFFKKQKKSNADEKQPKAKEWVVWAIFGLFGLYVLLIKIIGFIVASFLFMTVVYFIVLPEKKPIKKHVLPLSGLLVVAAILALIFENALNVFLPKGIFF